jgi:hypothetical protein
MVGTRWAYGRHMAGTGQFISPCPQGTDRAKFIYCPCRPMCVTTLRRPMPSHPSRLTHAKSPMPALTHPACSYAPDYCRCYIALSTVPCMCRRLLRHAAVCPGALRWFPCIMQPIYAWPQMLHMLRAHTSQSHNAPHSCRLVLTPGPVRVRPSSRAVRASPVGKARGIRKMARPSCPRFMHSAAAVPQDRDRHRQRARNLGFEQAGRFGLRARGTRLEQPAVTVEEHVER